VNGNEKTAVMMGGNMVIFVIGANATGKSRFIERNFTGCGYTVLNVYDYQKRIKEDKRFQGRSPFEQLFQANEMLKADIVDLVRRGQDVVVEQTFFRALRRIDFIEAIREAAEDVPVEVYVMTPSDEQLWQNCVQCQKESGGAPKQLYDRIKREISDVFEFPNPAEGFSKIYAVSGDDVAERRDAPDWTIVEKARAELRQEAEKRAKRQAAAERHEQLIQKTKHIRFWHYCEVCGKKELLTADEAFEQGWDYPPGIYYFRLLTPRKCGNCPITETVSFKLATGQKRLPELTDSEWETVKRIMNEPESLMPTEDDLKEGETP